MTILDVIRGKKPAAMAFLTVRRLIPHPKPQNLDVASITLNMNP